jgi:DNA polymerase
MSAVLTRIALQPGADITGFRRAARALIAAGAPPQSVCWDDQREGELFGSPCAPDAAPIMLPKEAHRLVRSVACHSDPERYGRLYALLWRLTHGEPSLLEVASDPLVHRLRGMAKSVHRDLHKMHAFVRFRRLELAAGEERYVAWFEPAHWILEATASFFIDRFRGMDWAILTPRGSLHWDMRTLRIGPPASRADAPASDAFESSWLAYYESIFNPARLNPTVMRGHMAVKYWRNLPEAAVIPDLVRNAPARVQQMIEREARMPTKRTPEKALAAMTDQAPRSLEALNRQIAESRPPEPFAPRAVLGEGPHDAAIALVGEQPGDQEEIEGRPFVGPAGRLLDRALAEAGVQRSEAYVTNAVKHFKFRQVGKRRIHQSPTAGEIKHYRWWLQRELEFVRPRVVVALGATAAQALAGRPVAVTRARGASDQLGPWAGVITVHPSSLLRADEADRPALLRLFEDDLKLARTLAGESR